MNQVVGFGYALVATFLFGIYMVPRQYTRISQRAFLAFMGIGILISASIIGLAGEGILPINFLQYILTFAAGLAWSLGALGYAVSVDYLGISRATPIKNTYGALSTIFGVVIFHEFTLASPHALTLAVVGSLAIVISASLLGRIEATRSMTCQPADRRCIMIGVLFAVVSAVGYGVRSIPTKIVLSQGVSAETFIFYMAHGAFVGNLIATKVFPKVDRARPAIRDCLLAILSGVTWTAAAEFLNLAVIAVGISVAFPLANLSTLVAVAYGLVILRDIDFRTHKASFWSGLVISVLGAALLAGALNLRT